jgi:prepilin-type N-terminal cleavage/methylation domain-containing protein
MMKKRQGCLEYNYAYTLIEVMLALAIVSVILIEAQRTLLEFHRIAVLEKQKVMAG